MILFRKQNSLNQKKIILDISNLAPKTTLTTAENKIPNVSGLATKPALTAVENKIHDVTNLAKKIRINYP